jgi:5-methylcytosine-specific restriction endonuclease McrA
MNPEATQRLIERNKQRTGWKHTAESKKKISESQRGKAIPESTRQYFREQHRGKHFSPATEFKPGSITQEMREKVNASLPRGKNHWNWRGGIAKERDVISQTNDYRTWVKRVFERDDYTCVRCFQRGGDKNAHHIIPFSVAPEERFNVDNGATTCPKCHYYIHSKELVVNQHV